MVVFIRLTIQENFGYVEIAIISTQAEVPQDSSEGKIMLDVFFDIQGIVHLEFYPQGCTMNKKLCIDVLRRLCQSIRKKRQKLWAEQSWMRLPGNAPAYRCLLVPLSFHKCLAQLGQSWPLRH
ncbi:hypothetical protein TNCV_4228891 [Trichonephila clavipes]|nr:hypothetical protein TNCV_4228891 [Trichonephila clavipes]